MNQTKQITHKVQAPPNPQNQVMNWLQAQSSSDERKMLISYFSKPIIRVALKEVRSLWKDIRVGNVTLEQIFRVRNELGDKLLHPEIEVPTLEELKQEDLQIISWMALS